MKFLVYRSSNMTEQFAMEIDTLEDLCDYADSLKCDVIVSKREDWEKEQAFADVDFALEVYDDWRE